MPDETAPTLVSSKPTTPSVQPPFDEVYTELEHMVDARRHKWVYTSFVEWADIKQRIIIRLWTKYPLYDATKGPLKPWASCLIKNELLNCNRDLGLQRLQRPCVGGGKTNGKSCVFNTGGTSCSYTPSQTQCNECPLYKEWQEHREPQWHIKGTVALENHAQEVHTIPGDFTDIEGAKTWVDQQMLGELTRWEGRIYRCLYVKHMSPNAVSKELAESAKTRKRPLRPDQQTSYQSVLASQRRFKAMMIDLLRRGGYLQ